MKTRLLLLFLLLSAVAVAGCGGDYAETAADCYDDEYFDPVDQACYLIEDGPPNDVPAMTADDCYDDEYFDPVDQTCYLLDEGDGGFGDYVETAADCYDDEYFDPVDQLCYLSEDADYGEASSLLDEIFGIFGEGGQDYQDLDEFDEGAIVTYVVSGNDITSPQQMPGAAQWPQYADDTAAHEAIWVYFASLIPAAQRGDISKFSIFTDGESNVYAAVGQDSDDPTQWILAVDIVDAENRNELTYSLIHEFGHLLTLNERQIEINTDIFYQQDNDELYQDAAASCDTFFPGEGCSLPTSYINLFYGRFWTDLEDEFYAMQDIMDQDAYDNAVYEFYQRYPDHFVTDYAATNPGEDIAESWTAFVMQERPTGNTIADQKVLFFYEFPELVELRGQIAARAFSRLRR